MDETAVKRLRSGGATDEMIAMLRRASFVPPASSTSVVAQTGRQLRGDSISADITKAKVATAKKVAYTRDELAPLYFRRGGAFVLFAGAASMTYTGGSAEGFGYRVGNQNLILHPPALPKIIPVYGFRTASASGAALDIEFSSTDALFSCSLGLGYEPFLPMGSSGWRVVLGGTGKVSCAQENLGRVPGASPGTLGEKIQVVNWGLGWDAGGGLAYHFAPGTWVSLDWRVRQQTTFSRHMLGPGNMVPIGAGDIPWSAFAARGSVIRLSFVF